MKVEVFGVQYAEFASEETNCFECAIWIDGRRAGKASNAGKGGPTWFYPPSLEDKLNEHCKTLPPYKIDHPGLEGTYEYTADVLIETLVQDELLLRKFRQERKEQIIFTRTDEPGVFHTRKFPPDALKYYLGRPLPGAWHVDKVLNLLPESEAVKILKKFAT